MNLTMMCITIKKKLNIVEMFKTKAIPDLAKMDAYIRALTF